MSKSEIKVDTGYSENQSQVIMSIYNQLPEFNKQQNVCSELSSNGNCGLAYNSYYDYIGSQEILVSEVRRLILLTSNILTISSDKVEEVDEKIASEIEKNMKVCLL